MKTLLGLLLFALLSASPALAHPPSDILATYDNSNHFLTVRALHGTMNAGIHYIKYIEVKLNGQSLIAQNFKSQYSGKEQDAVVLLIDLKPGNEIAVNAKCNMFGEKTKLIKI